MGETMEKSGRSTLTEAVLEKYEMLEERKVEGLHSQGWYLRHKKSGARVLILSNDDENKVFYIGFRTPPKDSTGVPHILEHSVLCGSRKFPVKDPFVELVKGSLNTFLNAMTYSDKTVYPVASCNDTDFQNLMDVYMDAVFYPNIYRKKEIFLQEGWHYDLEEAEGELKYNGVVYNEMKGAFSTPEGVLDRVIESSLFPDSCYAFESGGDPEEIPGLTYEEFLEFHRTYYHPSNSYIYLYGDMDVEEKLLWLDEQYLGSFDRRPVDSAVAWQEPFAAPVRLEKEYSISQDEREEDNTYLSYNRVVGTSRDPRLYLAFSVLEYVLLGAPGAPLKQALLDAGIGKDIMSSYDNGIAQPVFSVIAKNANVQDEERFVQVIGETLARLAKEGLNRRSLLAGLNYYEFRYREADFGAYPKGLMYGLQTLDSWLYDDSLPFLHIDALDTFRFLREQVDTGYYEGLVEKYLLDNPHGSVVVVKPLRGLTGEMDRRTREKLAAYKAGLSREETEALVEQGKRLAAYQESEDRPEDLARIPVLKLSDIPREAERIPASLEEAGGVKVLRTQVETNGIGYVELDFGTEAVPQEYVPYLGLLPAVLGYVDTGRYTYTELFDEINIQTGGIAASLAVYGNVKDYKAFRPTLAIRAKALYGQLPQAFDLMREIITSSRLDDRKRMREIIAKAKSSLQMTLMASGHSAAAMRAMSYTSPVARYTDATSGIAFYRLLERLDASFGEEYGKLQRILSEVMGMVFTRDRLLASYTAGEDGGEAERQIGALAAVLPEGNLPKASLDFAPERENEGFLTASKVQYVACAGNYRDAGFAYTGALRILKVMLSYDYLWLNLRVKGGAYGCMSSFSRIGDSYLVTYRDPHLSRTRQVFLGTPDYLERYEADEKTMRKYIIGTMGEVDAPLTPSAKGRRVLSMYCNGLTWEDVQREREQILDASAADIRALAPLVRAVVEDGSFCAIGGEEKIQAEAALFGQTCSLIRS